MSDLALRKEATRRTLKLMVQIVMYRHIKLHRFEYQVSRETYNFKKLNVYKTLTHRIILHLRC
jgi:hypothetical protein